MGRGKVELKKIENKINRQVTFTKRRNGLLKKAYELSILCDAEVALIIFSARAKLYEFSSSSSMAKTLERYQKYTYGTLAAAASQSSNDPQRCRQEYLQLKADIELLQSSQKRFLGEDLDHLGMEELDQLETQLEISLKQIRSTMSQSMFNQFSDLQRKEEKLLETNQALRKKLEESEAGLQSSQSKGFLQPLQGNNSLQINSYNDEEIPNQGDAINWAADQANGLPSQWMNI